MARRQRGEIGEPLVDVTEPTGMERLLLALYLLLLLAQISDPWHGTVGIVLAAVPPSLFAWRVLRPRRVVVTATHVAAGWRYWGLADIERVDFKEGPGPNSTVRLVRNDGRRRVTLPRLFHPHARRVAEAVERYLSEHAIPAQVA
ncbi:MAG TPA: hypothetical protein PLV13_11730 [Ilumatobacteraceae bacterium]|nr:hypothetical protein [Ilumatobacteraceae bacterium]